MMLGINVSVVRQCKLAGTSKSQPSQTSNSSQNPQIGNDQMELCRLSKDSMRMSSH